MWKSLANILFFKHFPQDVFSFYLHVIQKKRWSIQWIQFLVEIQPKWDPCNPKHSYLLGCNSDISVAWVEVFYLYLSSEFGHIFFQSSATKPAFMKLLYMRQLPLFEEKKNQDSIEQIKTCTFSCYWGFILLLFSTSFEIVPTCIIIFFMTQKKLYSLFPKVLFGSKHLHEFLSLKKTSV